MCNQLRDLRSEAVIIWGGAKNDDQQLMTQIFPSRVKVVFVFGDVDDGCFSGVRYSSNAAGG